MVSKWIEHVQKYAKDNEISYKEAMSSAKESYVKEDKKVKVIEDLEKPDVKVKKVKKIIKKKD